MYSNTTLKNPNPTSDGNQYFSGFDNTAFGNSSLLNNTIGSSNTALGTYSMNSNIKGVGNTTVGANSDIGSDSLFGATAIGFQSKVNCNYCLVLGTVTQSNSEKENTRVGIGTIAPDSSAILELKSSSKGLLIPRMNQAQREGIPTPLEGLLVYQTNNNKGFWYFDGSIWVNISFNNPSLTTVPTFSINSNKNSEIIYIENNLTSPLLGQNIPNPTGKTTLIPYRLPSNCKDAAIVITSMSSGQIIKAIPISARETQLSIDASKLASGSYSYSLYMEGRPVETKKMVIGR
jgi:hypothetical protein